MEHNLQTLPVDYSNLLISYSRNSEKQTPLHTSAPKGHLEVYKLLSENVDNKNPKDKHGQTPLHLAALHGHLEFCRCIITNLVDKNPVDYDFNSPFSCAASNGHLEICILLIGYLVNKNPVSTSRGCTALHLASERGHLEVCKLIISHCNDKNPANSKGFTPLHFAARKGQWIVYAYSFEFVAGNLRALLHSSVDTQNTKC